MRNVKASKIMAVAMASVLVMTSPVTAFAETTKTQVTVVGEGSETVDAVSNSTADTGVSMRDDNSSGTKLNGNVTVKEDVTVGDKDAEPYTAPQGVDIYSDGGSATVDIGGSINVEATKDESYYAQGINTSLATTDITVGGDVKVTNNTKYGIALAVSTGSNKDDVTFDGDNTINIKGNVEATADNNFAEGIIIYDKTDMTVGGDVIVSSENANAIGAYLGSNRSEGELKIDGNVDVSGKYAVGLMITTDSIEAGKGKDIDVTVGGDVKATGGETGGVGIYLSDNDKNISITVEGDINGTNYGILSKGDNTGEANVVSGGTVSAEKGAAIVVYEPSDGEKAPDITVWKLESSSGSLVAAYDSKGQKSDSYAETVSKSINYIIKANTTLDGQETTKGQIKLKGTTGTVTVGDKTYDTANQGNEITINVETVRGYKYSLTAGQGVLTKNVDGTYTLTIPEGGGVELNAVLEKIQSSSSGGSGSSSSTSNSNTNTWSQDSNGWRIKKSNGSYASNEWINITWNGQTSWYHFNSNGYADGGWFTDTDGQKYYLYNVHDGRFGYMLTGWHLIDGKWYFFNTQKLDNASTGSLVVNGKTSDGYNVDANGAWIQ